MPYPADPMHSAPPPPEFAGAAGSADAAEDEEKRLKKEKKRAKKESKKNRLGSGRGVETLFRTSYRTHIDMSSLADSKANIMISINGLMASILLASISPKIDANPWLLLPTMVLLGGCLGSLVFAVLSARPRLTSRMVTLDEVRRDAANILFFGNFTSLPQDDYVTGMTELIRDTERLYVSMLRDIYNLGSVLDRKFRLLRYSYTIFMWGLILGIGLFAIVFLGIVLFGTPPRPVGTPAF